MHSTGNLDKEELLYSKSFLRSVFGTSSYEYFKEKPAENNLLVPGEHANNNSRRPYAHLII